MGSSGGALHLADGIRYEKGFTHEKSPKPHKSCGIHGDAGARSQRGDGGTTDSLWNTPLGLRALATPPASQFAFTDSGPSGVGPLPGPLVV